MKLNQLPNKLTHYTPLELRYYIHNIMLALGVPGSLKGSRFLSYMIEKVYYDPESIQNVMRGLYQKTAEEYNTKVSNVERNCRTVINRMVTTEKYYDFCRRINCFQYEEPSVRNLVALLGEALRHGLIDEKLLILPLERR